MSKRCEYIILWKITSKRSEDATFQNWTNVMSAALKFNEWAFNCIILKHLFEISGQNNPWHRQEVETLALAYPNFQSIIRAQKHNGMCLNELSLRIEQCKEDWNIFGGGTDVLSVSGIHGKRRLIWASQTEGWRFPCKRMLLVGYIGLAETL